MDDEIQFGDLEESRPDVQLRPDRNRHYAVAAYQVPQENDLPIFVDLDVMGDIEAHAQEDTNVELGGVLLGGQYEDDEGNPFVVVTDSLRAQHYEATKGSFKFTHETWEQISRERDEFPEDLQMVGWYHTHPDWGVFLSGMDMFICDNFFNRPLDLALVVDPCRGDRGMFMWTGDPTARIRRTGGFYLIASRFRQYELELFSCQLEGKLTMASDPRIRPVAGSVGPAPVVNISEPRNQWQPVAVLAMLMMQFFVLVLIAWRLVGPPTDEEIAKEERKKLDKVEEKIDSLLKLDREELEREAQSDLLKSIVSHLEGGPTIAEEYENLKSRVLIAEAAADGHATVQRNLKSRVDDLEYDLKRKTEDLEKEEKQKERYKKKSNELSDQVDALERDLEKYTGKKADSKDDDDEPDDRMVYIIIASAVGLILIALVGGYVAIKSDEEREEDYDAADDDPPKSTNTEE